MFCRSVFILYQLALLYKGMVLGCCCSLTGLRSNSVYTMSWSEMSGMVSVLITLPWWFVRIRSSVFCWRVGSSTSWVRASLFSTSMKSVCRLGALKDRASFFFVFLEKPLGLYEVCLIRIQEQVGEKRSTVCSHRYADYLLKNTSTKHNKYVVNQKLEHCDDISCRELFCRIRVWQYLSGTL
jgi:hypothetical protein